MASATIRTPMEKFFAATDKNDQKSILTQGVGFVQDFCNKKGLHFAYEVSAQAKDELTKMGIQLHPVPFLTHSHPICKMIENHFLINVLPSFLSNSKWVFSSIKGNKIESIVKKAGGAKNNISFVNKVVCAKDFGRYDIEPNEGSFKMNYRSKDALFPKNYLRAFHDQNIFIQDEVHHWSKLDMIDFLESVKPKRFLFSVVYPPELLAGILEPQNAHIYTYRVDGGSLFFFPDGCKSKGYEQRLDLSWLFKASHFETEQGIFTVKLIDSVYAHHLFEICRGNLATDSQRFFSDFSTIDLKVIHKQRFRYEGHIPIKKRHVEKIYSYLMCLKKPDVESAMAKLRQILEDEHDCQVSLFFQKFAKEIINTHKGKWDLFGVSWIEKSKDIMLSLLPPVFGRLFSRWNGGNIFEFLLSLDTICIKVPTEIVNRTWLDKMLVYEINDDIWKNHLPEMIDIAFSGGERIKRADNRISFSTFGRKFLQRVSLNLEISRKRREIDDCLGRERKMLGWTEAPHSFLNYYIIKVTYSSHHILKKEGTCEIFGDFGTWIESPITPDPEEKICLFNIMTDIWPEWTDNLLDWLFESDEQALNLNGCAKNEDLPLVEGSYVTGSSEDKIQNECQAQASCIPDTDVCLDLCASNSPLYEKELLVKSFLKKCSDSVDLSICNVKRHFTRMLVIGDGNCFYRAIRAAFYGSDDGWDLTKKNIFNNMGRMGIDVPSDLLEQVRDDGKWVEHWVVELIPSLFNINLFVRQSCEGDLFLKMSPLKELHAEDPFKDIYIEHVGDHFNALFPDAIDLSNMHIEGGFSTFTALEGIINDIELGVCHFKRYELGNRVCFFLTDDSEVDYSHNKIVYPVNVIDDVNKLLPVSLRGSYNACLLQKFERGGIGLHRDDEQCYDNNEILSITLFGSASFIISNGETLSFDMVHGSWIKMLEGFQKAFKHGVQNCSEGRWNITFRTHVRKMNGELIQKMPINNGCMLDAIADSEGTICSRDVFKALCRTDKSHWVEWAKRDGGATLFDFEKACKDLKLRASILTNSGTIHLGKKKHKLIRVRFDGKHFEKFVDQGVGHVLEVWNEAEAEDKHCIDQFENLLNAPGVTQIPFKSSSEFANILRQSFMDRTTGIICSDIYNDSSCLKNLIFSSDVEYNVTCITGFAGSGKSFRLQQTLRGLQKEGGCKFMVISPRKFLAEEWKEKIGTQRGVHTFESALSKSFSKVEALIIDELTLMPNGYLDLVLQKLNKECKRNVKIFCIFDPLQGFYYNETDERLLDFEHEAVRLCKSVGALNYLAQSFRLSETFFGPFFKDIKCLKKGNFAAGFDVYETHLIAISQNEKEGKLPISAILVASRDEKKALKCNKSVYTFGESQGLNLGDHCLIVLSDYSAKQDEFKSLVAMTRACQKVSFAINYGGGLSGYLNSKGQSIFSLFAKGEPFSKRRMELMAGVDLNFQIDQMGGRVDEVDREDRLEGDLALKGFIFLGQRINSEEEEIVEPETIEPRERTHLMLCQENFAVARNFDLIRAKELREFRLREMQTQQFCHDYERVGPNSDRHVAGPLRFESIFPRHKNDDDLTFLMAVKKRLRFSSEAKERAKLKDASGVGRLLYRNFKEKFNLSFKFDNLLLEECINDFEVKKLEKSKATLEAHCCRSDVDWMRTDVFLFMKNQLCTKYEKQYVDAKAGQTLACFHHMILVKFAPYCRYMEKVIRSQLPDNIYIHSNKNFNDLNEWTKRFFRGGKCIESDYEAFDASQDEHILAFELALMEDMNMPNWLMRDYEDLKVTLGCKLGHFAIMRFTGEFCTFLFNTLANMAFTAARYDIEPTDPIAFAGDDMCMLVNRDKTDAFEELFEKISLKAKVIRTETPMFCGWNLSRHGIVKEPELVYNRFMVAKERGNVMECLENYAIEVSYAYMLGEKLYEVLKREEQIEYHQAVVRFIVKRLSHLKTKVKDLFSDQCQD